MYCFAFTSEGHIFGLVLKRRLGNVAVRRVNLFALNAKVGLLGSNCGLSLAKTNKVSEGICLEMSRRLVYEQDHKQCNYFSLANCTCFHEEFGVLRWCLGTLQNRRTRR